MEKEIQNWINSIVEESLIILDKDCDISMCMHNKLVDNFKKIKILLREC